MLVLTFAEYTQQAERLALALGNNLAIVDVHHFPDGESRIRLPAKLPKHVIVCRSLDQPNEKLVELLLCAETARQLGAQHLTLVAPYLCYMRQDVAFTPGESVSQKIIGRYLAGQFDAVVTVDPHLHRVARLDQAVPAKRAIALTAAETIGTFLAQQHDQALLIGPDEESEQWVAAAARAAGWAHVTARKERQGDRAVQVRLPDIPGGTTTAIIVDDIASTGHTIAAAARELRARGVATIDAAVTHGLFEPGAVEFMRDAGVQRIWHTDSVSSRGDGIPLAQAIATALKHETTRNSNAKN